MSHLKIFSHFRLKIFFLFLISCSGTSLHAQLNSEQLLNTDWQFRKAGDKEWLPATVPGTVHTDLLANKKIPDPFWSSNEKNLQWIENEDWEYQTYFSVDDKIFNSSHIDLVFEGLDTYSKVYLNDSVILSADNMFRTWKADVKKYLRNKNNHLLIHFESAVRKGKELARRLLYTLPGDEKIFARKAQYQYGWDWGPRFVTCGIWRNVKLAGWGGVRIKSVYTKQNFLNNELVDVNFLIEAECDREGDYKFSVSSKLAGTTENNFALKAGTQTISLTLQMLYPKKWWCNGIGKPYLYDFTCNVSSDGKITEKKNISVGIRKLELIQEDDRDGRSFY